MKASPLDVNKTITRADLDQPEVAAQTRALNQLGRQLWLQRVPYAVNGALRMRFKGIRWNKLWEYGRGLAYGDFQHGMRVLDFGGGATIPLFYLARQGCDVLSLDIDAKLTEHTNLVGQQMHWPVKGSTHDLTATNVPAEWGKFDRVISFCVIEHIPKDRQRLVVQRIASLLKPGGLFELTFDFDNAPTDCAIRTAAEVNELIAAAGLKLEGDGQFHDTGERFVIDKKYPSHHFTFGSLFLRKS